MAKVVCISYDDLLDPSSDLTRELVQVITGYPHRYCTGPRALHLLQGISQGVLPMSHAAFSHAGVRT